MAHWIIEDHGFGGQYYRCSECRESWCDIYKDVSMEETCPHCGAPINEDENEYLENKTKLRTNKKNNSDFKIGELVCAEDGCYGIVTAIDGDSVTVIFKNE